MDRDDHSAERFDLYRTVTDKIVEAIEKGAGAFVMPWHSRGGLITRPENASTGNSYRGVNVMALWAAAMLSGYGSGHWASFKQWQALGAQVRKGEHGTTIVFYKPRDWSEEEREAGASRLIARASRVFNAAQVAGWRPEAPPPVDPVRTLERVEAFTAATKAEVRHGQEHACYRRDHDRIELPEPSRFVGTPTSSPTEAYYATLLHELTHWTGAAHRLNRTFGERYGDHAYAMEELVALSGQSAPTRMLH